MSLRRVVRMRHRAGAGAILRLPLMRTGRALRQFPFVAEQVLEEVVAPLRGRGGPGDFQAAGDRVARLCRCRSCSSSPKPCSSRPAASGSGPTCDAGRGAVGLAEGMAAGDERDGFLVVHRHAAEGLADIVRRRDRIGIAVRAFGVDVDQAHLHRGERILQLARVDVSIRVVVGHEHRAVLLDAVRSRARSGCRRRARSSPAPQ